MRFFRCSSFCALPIRSCIVKELREPPSLVRMVAANPLFKIPSEDLKKVELNGEKAKTYRIAEAPVIQINRQYITKS